ncbi:hypothetical protein HCC47_05265 [Streptococcus suis]|nr:hypothetical protein [Streptococcus suis]
MIDVHFFEEEQYVTYITVENRASVDKICRIYVDGKMIGMAKIPAKGTKEFPARNYKEGSRIVIR